MVHFVRLAQSPKIPIVCVIKPLKTTVNQYVMYKKIGYSIQEYAKSNGYTDDAGIHHPKHDTKPAGNGIDEKENIIAFKHLLMWNMMIFMKVPHESMHNKTVS
jgi:hypothetical protein